MDLSTTLLPPPTPPPSSGTNPNINPKFGWGIPIPTFGHSSPTAGQVNPNPNPTIGQIGVDPKLSQINPNPELGSRNAHRKPGQRNENLKFDWINPNTANRNPNPNPKFGRENPNFNPKPKSGDQNLVPRPTSDRHQKAHCIEIHANQSPASSSPTTEQTQSKEFYECVIVGAGISGLCTAQALTTKHGFDISRLLITEARDRVGGTISTVQRGEYLWEEGPHSFQPSDPLLTMVVDAGLKHELVLGDPMAMRYVYWQGKLRPVPSGPTDFPFFDLLSIQGKLRAGLGALGIRPPPPGYEESVEEFVRRNLGAEVFERLIEPFCSGVYAGNPAKLSMKATFGRVWKLEDMGGSILGGTFKLIQNRNNIPTPPRDPRLPTVIRQTVGSFRKGLITLPKAIAERLGNSVKLNWTLESVQVASRGVYELMYKTPEGLKTVLTKAVVLTVPAYVASNILRPLSKLAADSLSKVSYPPLATVTLSYPKSSIREDRLVNGELKGFCQLHPRNQGIQTLGTIYSSSLFPGRAPSGHVLLVNYIGGVTNPDIINMTEAELVNQVDKDIRKMLIKPDAPRPKDLAVRVWPRAIPQFDVGHFDILKDAHKALDDSGLDGLFLSGNYVIGVTLSQCVEGAYECAQSISQFSRKVSSIQK